MLEGLVLGVIFATIILFLVFFLVWRFRTFLTFFWHEKVLLSIVNFISGMSKEERILSWVKEHAVPGNPQSVLDAIDYYCYNNEWAMNVGDTKGAIMDKIVEEAKPRVLLELGTYCGYSAIRMARLLPPGARLFTIEFNESFASIAGQMIQVAGLQDKVSILKGPSHEVIPQLRKKHEIDTVDLVFLDHWKDRYLPDTRLLLESGLLRKGTVLLADNVICPGAPDFLQYVRSHPRFECTHYPANVEYLRMKDALEKAVFLG